MPVLDANGRTTFDSGSNPIKDEIKDLHSDKVGWPRDLHAHPELEFAETRTSTFLQERLTSFGSGRNQR